MNAGAATEPDLLSVCIPALNEAESLPRLISQLRSQRDVQLEIIIADGGSNGRPVATLPAGVKIITAPRGRALQMNAAARTAGGKRLLFLHADSTLDDPHLLGGALAALATAQQAAGNERVAGHFRLRFRRTSGPALLYRYMEAKTALNRPGTINGDQGLLIERTWFEALGGFDERVPLAEDQDIADRIRADGQWITLPGTLETSARRFETLGSVRVFVFMAIIMAMRHTGRDRFLAAVPALYQTRLRNGRLNMQAIFAAFRDMQRARPLRERLRLHYRVGRYVRSNAWQSFFFCDVALGLKRRPLLAFHDRALAPLLRNPLVDAVSGALTYLWVLVILRMWFIWRDRKQ